MSLVISNATTLNGTSDADLLIGRGVIDTRTFYGTNGNDILLAGYGPAIVDTAGAHATKATALSLDAASYWSTGINPFVGDDSVPYTTIVGTGDGSGANWYAVYLDAGQRITLDVDFAAQLSAANGISDRASLLLYDAAGTRIGSSSGSTAGAGGLGSIVPNFGPSPQTTDPYLTYVAKTSGTYYVQLGTAANASGETGEAFALEVSVTGHAASGTASAATHNAMNGGEGNDQIYGGDGNDTLSGGGGNDLLYGGAGADYMTGGAGNDVYYVDNVGDKVKELDGGGSDVIYASVSYSLAAIYVESLELTGTDDIDATGNGRVNLLIGNTADNVLDGGAGADSMSGGPGNDTYYVDNAGDTVGETENGGNDTIYASVSYTVPSYSWVEHTILTGSADLNLTGAGTLVGNSGDNILTSTRHDNGVSGATLVGGAGDDAYYVIGTSDRVIEKAGEGNDTVYSTVSFDLGGTYVETLTLTGTADINATGNGQVNTLIGNDGANTLNGMGGADHMEGGKGNDIYYVDNIGDTITEHDGEGTDTVYASVSYSLAGAYLERLTLTGTGATTATGNHLNNVLTGNAAANTLIGDAGNDILDGKGGGDRMIGGTGDDAYYVDNPGDRVVEKSGEGTDIIYSSVSYDLAAQHVETLTLTGTAALSAYGNSQDNTLNGNDGNNILDGRGGEDTMAGGLGDDVYYVDARHYSFGEGDIVIEAANAGIDTIHATTIGYTLPDNVENGIMDSTADRTGSLVGNALDNTLIGNSGADTLDGAAGVDTMIGGVGDDTYYVDNPGDKVIEAANGGNDSVSSTATFDIAGQYIENLYLSGPAAINAYGNGLDNTLYGNIAANILDGRDGADDMIGGDGNDTYYVDNPGDRITERADNGIDLVHASISYTLAVYIENLTLDGTADIDGTGSTVDNVLIGNTGDNMLTGAGGADTFGGFTSGFGKDVITDFGAGSATGHDLVQFDHTLFADYAAVMAHAQQVGSGVVITDTAGDTLTLQHVTLGTLVSQDFAFI